jgi:metal-sulfur cluster biosynthetic enzyme
LHLFTQGAQTLLIPLKEAKQTIGPSDILKKMNPNLRKKLRVVTDPEIQKELISLEEQTRVKIDINLHIMSAY